MKYINALSSTFDQLVNFYNLEEELNKEKLVPVLDLINEVLNEEI